MTPEGRNNTKGLNLVGKIGNKSIVDGPQEQHMAVFWEVGNGGRLTPSM
jgi:hypothetical protein